MRNESKKQISDDYGQTHAYETQQFGSSESFRLLTRLTVMAGEPIGAVVGVAAGMLRAGDDAGREAAMLGQGVRSLAMNIIAEGGPEFVKEILRHTTRDGKKLGDHVAFEQAFMGNMGELFGAVYFVLEVNYGSLLRTHITQIWHELLRATGGNNIATLMGAMGPKIVEPDGEAQ